MARKTDQPSANPAGEARLRRRTDPELPWAERKSPLLTPAEAADYLGITEKHVRNLFYDEKLHGCYVGSLLRFHIDDLDAFIESNRTTQPRRMANATYPLRKRSSRRPSAS